MNYFANIASPSMLDEDGEEGEKGKTEENLNKLESLFYLRHVCNYSCKIHILL